MFLCPINYCRRACHLPTILHTRDLCQPPSSTSLHVSHQLPRETGLSSQGNLPTPLWYQQKKLLGLSFLIFFYYTIKRDILETEFINFNACIGSCCHHHNQDTEKQFHHPPKSFLLYLLVSVSLSTSNPWQPQTNSFLPFKVHHIIQTLTICSV